MAKKKKASKHIHNKPVKSPATTVPSWHLPVILMITFLIYLPVLNAGFVNWDDPDYVIDNFRIKDISNIVELITIPVQGNYHPLTMISLAINYQISGDAAWSYHLFNLLFHLVNCVLVYRLAFALGKNIAVAFITSLLFGIHPLHVESVAWVSERKDVLYALFFIAGHITYTKYIDTGIKKQFWLTLLFLMLSLLSKPAAVIFPFSLICIDILRGRNFGIKLISEKIIFIIPALIFGLLTLRAQQTTGATGEVYFNFFQNILFGCYGIMMYFLKLIFPFSQSAFYPFPPLNENLPYVYYLSPVFTLGLITIIYLSWKKFKPIAFGISFYIVNLLLVLQVFTVGSAVIAERYTYIPYIGLFYIAGFFIDRLTKKNNKKAFTIIAPIGLFFATLTYFYVQVWRNGETLWDNVIKYQPGSKAYDYRANLLKKEANEILGTANTLKAQGKLNEANSAFTEADMKYRLALQYYTTAISLNKIDHESFNNRANLYMDLNKFDSALLDYRNSLTVNPTYHVTYDNLGAMFARMNQLDSALYYLNKAIELKPDYKPAYSNRGLTLMALQRYIDAIKDWEFFLELQPNDPIVYNTIGLCYQKMSKHNESLKYFNKAITLNPLPPFLLNRSYAYFYLNNLSQARVDAQAAKQAGADIPITYLQQLGLSQ